MNLIHNHKGINMTFLEWLIHFYRLSIDMFSHKEPVVNSLVNHEKHMVRFLGWYESAHSFFIEFDMIGQKWIYSTDDKEVVEKIERINELQDAEDARNYTKRECEYLGGK